MNMYKLNEEAFLELGLEIMGRTLKSNKIALRRLTAYYGTSPKVFEVVWDKVNNEDESIPDSALPKYLLWGAHLIKAHQSLIRTKKRFVNGPGILYLELKTSVIQR